MSAYKAFLFFIITYSSFAYSQSDPFSGEAAQYGSVQEIPGQKLYIPISVGDILFFVVQDQEPPEAAATIQGEDVDGNGVRDDVQNSILEKYENNVYLRDRSLIMASRIQSILSGQTSNIRSAYIDIEKLQKCVLQNGGSDTEDGKAFIIPQMLSTYQRSVNYLNSVANGLSVAVTPRVTGCN